MRFEDEIHRFEKKIRKETLDELYNRLFEHIQRIPGGANYCGILYVMGVIDDMRENKREVIINANTPGAVDDRWTMFPSMDASQFAAFIQRAQKEFEENGTLSCDFIDREKGQVVGTKEIVDKVKPK